MFVYIHIDIHTSTYIFTSILHSYLAICIENQFTLMFPILVQYHRGHSFSLFCSRSVLIVRNHYLHMLTDLISPLCVTDLPYPIRSSSPLSVQWPCWPLECYDTAAGHSSHTGALLSLLELRSSPRPPCKPLSCRL